MKYELYVVKARPVAEFGSPQLGPNGEPHRALLATQAPLRLYSGATQSRLRAKQRPLGVEALTGAFEGQNLGEVDWRFLFLFLQASVAALSLRELDESGVRYWDDPSWCASVE
jgi:hypothetical protein